MANGGWQMADGRCEMMADGCAVGQNVEPMPQGCLELPAEASTTPPQAPRNAGTSGGHGEGERERSEPTPQKCRAPQKAANEAKRESTQRSLPHGLNHRKRGLRVGNEAKVLESKTPCRGRGATGNPATLLKALCLGLGLWKVAARQRQNSACRHLDEATQRTVYKKSTRARVFQIARLTRSARWH